MKKIVTVMAVLLIILTTAGCVQLSKDNEYIDEMNSQQMIIARDMNDLNKALASEDYQALAQSAKKIWQDCDKALEILGPMEVSEEFQDVKIHMEKAYSLLKEGAFWAEQFAKTESREDIKKASDLLLQAQNEKIKAMEAYEEYKKSQGL